MRISDWSSDVCSSDLCAKFVSIADWPSRMRCCRASSCWRAISAELSFGVLPPMHILSPPGETHEVFAVFAEPRPDAFAFGPEQFEPGVRFGVPLHAVTLGAVSSDRSEEPTSELQSLIPIS